MNKRLSAALALLLLLTLTACTSRGTPLTLSEDYRLTLDGEHCKVYTYLMLYPADSTCRITSPIDAQSITGTYTETEDTLTVNTDDYTYTFRKSDTDLVYVAEGSDELIARGSFFSGNTSKTMAVPDQAALQHDSTDILMTGIYVMDKSSPAKLQFNTEDMIYTLKTSGGDTHKGSFRVELGAVLLELGEETLRADLTDGELFLAQSEQVEIFPNMPAGENLRFIYEG